MWSIKRNIELKTHNFIFNSLETNQNKILRQCPSPCTVNKRMVSHTACVRCHEFVTAHTLWRSHTHPKTILTRHTLNVTSTKFVSRAWDRNVLTHVLTRVRTKIRHNVELSDSVRTLWECCDVKMTSVLTRVSVLSDRVMVPLDYYNIFNK